LHVNVPPKQTAASTTTRIRRFQRIAASSPAKDTAPAACQRNTFPP
jgi:hypothetical protein